MTITVNPNGTGDAEVASPCIEVCELDAHSVCIGCHRHSDEIMAWPSLDGPAKQAVLARADRRRQALDNYGSA